MMNIFKKIKSWFGEKPDEMKPLQTERPGIASRIAKMNMGFYIVKMAMMYEGKPHRQFQVRIKARSRDNAAFLANEKVKFKVISSRLDKSQSETQE